MADYTATIIESSSELSAKEKIALKDLSNAIGLDVETENGSMVFAPTAYAVLQIHNERSKNEKDYTKFIVIDDNGNKYVTGSKSFWQAFTEIWESMKADAPGELYSIEVYKKPSRNYQGKAFLTCSIVL